MRRAVITGLGAVSCIGNTSEEILDALKSGRSGIVANETLGYFMARTHLFFLQCGVKDAHLRFRQHLKNEMAHYACDCWDAEIEMSLGWVECVGG